ncbi:MAG: methyltransferase domain-containing protein [Methanothrix sp.]
MDPNKSEIKEKVRAFWDNPRQDYDASPGHGVNSPSEKEMWRKGMTQLLGPSKDLKILDIGTGTGFLALLLAEMGYNVTGVDWAKSKIQKAKEKAETLKIQVNFEVQDAETLSFPDDTFDAVVSRHVIWTLADPLTAARDWARVVHLRGKVIADIPHMKSHSGSHHFGEEVGRNLPFYKGAEPEKVANMFKEAGLTKVELLMLEKPVDLDKTTVLVYGEKG